MIRSCSVHVCTGHRHGGVSTWISTPGDGRRLPFGLVYVVMLRQQPGQRITGVGCVCN